MLCWSHELSPVPCGVENMPPDVLSSRKYNGGPSLLPNTRPFLGCHHGMCVCVCVCVLVAQSCLTLCDPMDCSLLGSSLHGIIQAGILEWVAISFSRGSSWLRDQTQVSCIAGRSFTVWCKPIIGNQINPWQQRQTFNFLCHLTTLSCWNCNHA